MHEFIRNALPYAVLLAVGVWVIAVLLGVFYGIDHCSGTRYTAVGSVIARTKHDGYSSILLAGKVPVPQYHPPTYSLTVSTQDCTIEASCSEALYDQMQHESPGTSVTVTYVRGGITGQITCAACVVVFPFPGKET